MDCLELRRGLADGVDGNDAAQQSHLKTCQKCSALLADMERISASARELREAAEPSPLVWNSIEIALRQEGLIHPPRPSRSLLPSLGSRWTWARWLAPAAAALLIAIGVYVRQHSANPPLAGSVFPGGVAKIADAEGLDDADLLQEIAQQSPAQREQYADNLRHVNDSIRDAQNDIAANPNDAEARHSLMDAYQQKAMLFELAMDRSLP